MITMLMAPLFALSVELNAPSAAVVVDPPACQMIALSLKKAARKDADAAFWVAVAKCFNGPSSEFACCFQEAWQERQDAYAEAQAQYQARLLLCNLFGPQGYAPNICPASFSPNITNPFLPFVPGRVLTYQKVIPEGVEQFTSTTLNETIDINGVICRVIHEVETLDGNVVEDTVDWLAQRNDGEVWYFGEISQNFEESFLDNLDGSWRYGYQGAQPGVLMRPCPTPGDAYRQEFLPAEAEDVARVISINETVVVAAGTFTGCIQTEEWTPLSPGGFERKFYAPGIGLVLEVDDAGQRLELISIVN